MVRNAFLAMLTGLAPVDLEEVPGVTLVEFEPDDGSDVLCLRLYALVPGASIEVQPPDSGEHLHVCIFGVPVLVQYPAEQGLLLTANATLALSGPKPVEVHNKTSSEAPVLVATLVSHAD